MSKTLELASKFNEYFTSRNDVPVDKALVKASEWQELYSVLHAELNAKQAKIDSLMEEYCPEDMTDEQIDEWAEHKVVIPTGKEALDMLVGRV
jgi:predicted transcriptional regulator YdeE